MTSACRKRDLSDTNNNTSSSLDNGYNTTHAWMRPFKMNDTFIIPRAHILVLILATLR